MEDTVFFYFKKKIRDYVYKNRFLFLFAVLLMIASVAWGCSDYRMLPDKTEAYNLLESVALDLPFQTFVRETFLKSSKQLLSVFLAATSVLGFPLIVYLVFLKCYALGFAFSGMLSVTAVHPTIAVITMLPQVICSVFSLVLLTQSCIRFTFCLCKATILASGKNNRLTTELVLCVAFLLLSVLFSLLSTLCEGYFMPKLL